MSFFRCTGSSKINISATKGFELNGAANSSTTVVTAEKKMRVIILLKPNNDAYTFTTEGTLLFKDGWNERTEGIIMRFFELNAGDSVTVKKGSLNYAYGRYYEVQ